MEVDAEQIADRVVVFSAIQASRGDTAGVRRRQPVDAIEFFGQPPRDRLALMLGRLRFFLRRHLATAELLDDLGPPLVIVGQRGGGLERLEAQPVFLFFVTVAGNAVFGDERTDERIKAFDGLLRRDVFGCNGIFRRRLSRSGKRCNGRDSPLLRTLG